MSEPAPLRVLVVSGSARRGSWNAKLAALAARSALDQGALVTPVDLRALALPIYDGDIEAADGPPAGAFELRRLFASHDALLLASPEYNGFVPPLLVNALDWTSRVKASDGLPAGLAAMNRIVAGLLSASPGNLGGARALIALRSFLSSDIGMLVVAPTHSVAKAAEAFDADGRLIEERHQRGLLRVVTAVLRTALALGAAPS